MAKPLRYQSCLVLLSFYTFHLCAYIPIYNPLTILRPFGRLTSCQVWFLTKDSISSHIAWVHSIALGPEVASLNVEGSSSLVDHWDQIDTPRTDYFMCNTSILPTLITSDSVWWMFEVIAITPLSIRKLTKCFAISMYGSERSSLLVRFLYSLPEVLEDFILPPHLSPHHQHCPWVLSRLGLTVTWYLIEAARRSIKAEARATELSANSLNCDVKTWIHHTSKVKASNWCTISNSLGVRSHFNRTSLADDSPSKKKVNKAA